MIIVSPIIVYLCDSSIIILMIYDLFIFYRLIPCRSLTRYDVELVSRESGFS